MAKLKLAYRKTFKWGINIKRLAKEYHVSFGDIQKWRDAIIKEDIGTIYHATMGDMGTTTLF